MYAKDSFYGQHPIPTNNPAPPVKVNLQMSDPTTPTPLHPPNKPQPHKHPSKTKTPQRHHKQLSLIA